MLESSRGSTMPNFNWDELDLEHRRYVCFLAGVHQSYAILPLRDFHERVGLRDGGSRAVLEKITTAAGLPLIVFSEYSDVFSEKEARSAGVSALVSKAEHVSVLLGKARALLYDVAA
jgi:hypothetical protein